MPKTHAVPICVSRSLCRNQRFPGNQTETHTHQRQGISQDLFYYCGLEPGLAPSLLDKLCQWQRLPWAEAILGHRHHQLLKLVCKKSSGHHTSQMTGAEDNCKAGPVLELAHKCGADTRDAKAWVVSLDQFS